MKFTIAFTRSTDRIQVQKVPDGWLHAPAILYVNIADLIRRATFHDGEFNAGVSPVGKFQAAIIRISRGVMGRIFI